MARHRILRQSLRDEARRTILREAEARYRHELLEDEERMLLLDRIKRLRRGLSCVRCTMYVTLGEGVRK